MTDKEITGTQLSNDLRISKTTVSSYVRGTVKRIDIEIMLQIANYLNVSLDELFGRKPYVVDNYVGNRIRRIRYERGLTMELFGKLLGTSKGTVNNWEKARNWPNKENMKKLAELAGISVEELVRGEADDK